MPKMSRWIVPLWLLALGPVLSCSDEGSKRAADSAPTSHSADRRNSEVANSGASQPAAPPLPIAGEFGALVRPRAASAQDGWRVFFDFAVYNGRPITWAEYKQTYKAAGASTIEVVLSCEPFTEEFRRYTQFWVHIKATGDVLGPSPPHIGYAKGFGDPYEVTWCCELRRSDRGYWIATGSGVDNEHAIIPGNIRRADFRIGGLFKAMLDDENRFVLNDMVVKLHDEERALPRLLELCPFPLAPS